MSAAGLGRWTLTLPPGDVHEVSAPDWVDTLVVVERGELEVECRSGRRAGFAAGAVLTLAELPVRRLHSCGSEPLVLCAVTRVRPAPPIADRPAGRAGERPPSSDD
jgi:hypothetical protein